jgi:hypothetical protein
MNRASAARAQTRRTVLGGLAGLAFTSVATGCEEGLLVGFETITFNHEPNLAVPKALNLRKNATETVDVPEWEPSKREPEESPVAYSVLGVAGGPVTIKVRPLAYWVHSDGTFEPWTGEIVVRALGGGVLGAIDPTGIKFIDGVGAGGVATLTLSHHGIGSGGVRGVLMEDVEWEWEYREARSKAAFVPMGTTAHRVYVVYRKPRAPWSNTVGSTLNAWTDALDLACGITGDTGVTDDLDEITNALADLFNPGGGNCDTTNGSAVNIARLIYDAANPVPYYSTATTVNLTSFLERWRGGDGAGPLVNCSDCAALFSTLANLLGADLWQGQLAIAEVNPVMPIGCGSWWLPDSGYVAAAGAYPPETLTWHEVAWKGDVALGNLIWDVCYLVNGLAGASPDEANLTTRIIHYPWGIPFSDVPGELDYREMLAYPMMNNVANTQPLPLTKVRRTPA